MKLSATVLSKISVQIIPIVLFMTATAALPAAELILKSGDAFLGDVVREDGDRTLFRWRGKVYTIPRREIARVDYSKKGPHASYRISTFIMHGGSRIRGVVAEESRESVTVRTDLGFLTLERSKIKNTDYKPGRKIAPPAMYEKRLPDKKVSILGAQAPILWNNPRLARTHPMSFGLGVFVEPAFFNWGGLRFGYLLQILTTSSGTDSFLMMESFAYGTHDINLFGLQQAYGRIGAGVVQIRYTNGDTVVNGTDPAMMLELGRRFLLGSLTLSAAGRASCAFERKAYCMVGAIMGVSVAL